MSKKFVWPEGFLWGAATASHQVEGGNVNNWSKWELQTAKENAKMAESRLGWLESWPRIKSLAVNPDNYVSGLATDHQRRFREDFDIMEELHLNAFRFSIEWSRIEPEEGVWNIHGIEYYRTYIRELRRRGIEPAVTLYHWSVPLWFSEKGGFEKGKNIHYFVRYCQKVLEELGADIRVIFTINEPDTVAYMGYSLAEHPPAIKSLGKLVVVYFNLLRAHKKVYKIAKAINPEFEVGFVKTYAYVRPADKRWSSRFMARFDYFLRDDIALAFVGKQTDILGINYYFTDLYSGWKRTMPDAPRSDLGWTMTPENLERVLMRVGRKHVPLIITETGVADKQDAYRRNWIHKTILSVQRALQAGVVIKGYFHWTLMDNFEWAFGRWPAFGLVDIDYEHGRKRTIRPSARYYAAIIEKARRDAEKGNHDKTAH